MEKNGWENRNRPGALVMKLKIICLVCIATVAVASLIHHWTCHSCFSSHESLRDALGRQLDDARAFKDFPGTVVGASDVAQALKMFETHIMPTLEDRSESRIRGIRRLIAEGKAWVYTVSSDDWQWCYLLDLFPSLTSEGFDFEGFGFHYLVSFRNVQTGVFNPQCENEGLLELLPRENMPGDDAPVSAYEDYLKRLPRFKDALPRIGVAYPYADDGFVDVSAIVDVVDVQLVRVSDFDYRRMHQSSCLFWTYPPCCSAIYQIRLDVREVENGSLESDVYVLETRRTWNEFKQPREWLYFRGMTLRVSLHRDGSELLLIAEQLVEPYPPYSNDNVSISGGALVGGFRADKREGNLEPLIVAYGKHTKVEFKNGDILTSGEMATFPDFGVTSRFRILEMKDGANKEYWEGAWFAPREGQREQQ